MYLILRFVFILIQLTLFVIIFGVLEDLFKKNDREGMDVNNKDHPKQ